MNKQEYEQAKKIVEDAEKIGAAYVGYWFSDVIEFFIIDSKGYWLCWVEGAGIGCNKWSKVEVDITKVFKSVQKIQDLKTQIALYERVQELEKKINHANSILTAFVAIIDEGENSPYVQQFEEIEFLDGGFDGGYVVEDAKCYLVDLNNE